MTQKRAETTLHRAMAAETVQITGHNGDAIDAYVAKPTGGGPFAGVIVAHHRPGWDEWCIEVTRRFAHHGYTAICPNLHHRHGPGTAREMSERTLDAGGLNDAVVVGDLQGALDYLRAMPSSTGKVGVIGFCSGGRIAYMAGCKIGVDAVVDCWGGSVIPAADGLTPNRPVPVIDMTPDLHCPLLGLFGNDDEDPGVEQVNATEAKLKELGKSYEFHRYDGAGHAFFVWEMMGWSGSRIAPRTRYRPEQAADGWQQVWAFYDKHLR